ncbi:MAG TPA: L-seryl-tRNA(Sec) selenium transferase, partial [Candidatus Nanopelagicales bacterium]|nr:L-seryl-tRNA(Sec) selenium transferase [Candidatus Nanopelagicales bacterium]
MSATGPRPPGVERLLAAARPRAGEREHAALLAAARETVVDERARLAVGEDARPIEGLADAVLARLDAHVAGALPTRVINATGVIVHTNLGRAPWPEAAIRAAAEATREPLLLEMDRATGRRGRRYRAAEEHLVALTGAEDALVTNNCAAALVLAVGLDGRKGVVVGRGELVEIGGGVRIPEIVRRAGARLVEVGTTNRTRVDDYEVPLREGRAAMVLRVHPSNFTMSGFVETPDPAALAALAHAHGALVVDDLGSGALLDTAAFGLAHEPTPAERLAAGADLVVFSGDKLVGGPQAGLVIGRADLVARLRKDPLARAMRPDKATLAGVAATLGLYRAGLAVREIPVWRMIATAPAALQARADALAARVSGAAVVALAATVGGGSVPGETIPSFGL